MSTNDSKAPKDDRISLADEEGVKEVLSLDPRPLGRGQQPHAAETSRQARYRVTIFGSARVQPGTFGYEETKRVAAALADMGCDIITGGGPG